MPPKSTAIPADQPSSKILASLDSLHAKVDALPKCECASLKQEVAELKALLTAKSEPAPPPLGQSTYEVVKKALNDAKTYADKACRAVWVGRPEGPSPNDTLKSDQSDLEQLFTELNDPSLSKALADGHVTHHRHPEIKGDRKKRIMKISFPDQKTRDSFLFLARSTRPSTVTKQAGNYLRRDLCPYELELERQARIKVFINNVKAGALAYGMRDEQMIKFTGTPRDLPSGYESRPPRGYEQSLSHPNTKNNNSVLSNLSPMRNNSVNSNLDTTFIATPSVVSV